ncbi:hypothetical protein [Clostridium oryzae]|uniref:Uncharacterized protein n=1 Tax=Clostridium oryzae TaxID=1450648 RepID=A0A1V4IMZ0_9CLOT|nr:hypothetical protein [Clostridium oryzae]OPJ61209.1 hypothetical protein CLORY_24210 [Clostridium oryzae]
MYTNFNFGPGGTWGFPLIWNDFHDEVDNYKTAHDSYNVYVNNDYVGKKVLVAQGERVEDIKSFLNTQGFTEFSSEIVGNAFNIVCDEDAKEHIKEAVEVYIHNR